MIVCTHIRYQPSSRNFFFAKPWATWRKNTFLFVLGLKWPKLPPRFPISPSPIVDKSHCNRSTIHQSTDMPWDLKTYWGSVDHIARVLDDRDALIIFSSKCLDSKLQHKSQPRYSAGPDSSDSDTEEENKLPCISKSTLCCENWFHYVTLCTNLLCPCEGVLNKNMCLFALNWH